MCALVGQLNESQNLLNDVQIDTTTNHIHFTDERVSNVTQYANLIQIEINEDRQKT